VLPGLLAGSLVSVLLTAIEQQLGLLQGFLVPTLVRLGSAAQWLLACHLLGDWRAALGRPGSRVALRFVLTALGCCLIAPSAGADHPAGSRPLDGAGTAGRLAGVVGRRRGRHAGARPPAADGPAP
jgi:hypothetical protein